VVVIHQQAGRQTSKLRARPTNLKVSYREDAIRGVAVESTDHLFEELVGLTLGVLRGGFQLVRPVADPSLHGAVAALARHVLGGLGRLSVDSAAHHAHVGEELGEHVHTRPRVRRHDLVIERRLAWVRVAFRSGLVDDTEGA